MSNTVTSPRNRIASRVLRGAEASRSSSAKLDQIEGGFQGTTLQRIDRMLAEVLARSTTSSAYTADEPRAIRLPEVLRTLGIGKSSWYQRLNPRSPSYDSLAPQPFKLGNSERSPSLWWRSEIIAYLEIRATASRNR